MNTLMNSEPAMYDIIHVPMVARMVHPVTFVIPRAVHALVLTQINAPHASARQMCQIQPPIRQ